MQGLPCTVCAYCHNLDGLNTGRPGSLYSNTFGADFAAQARDFLTPALSAFGSLVTGRCELPCRRMRSSRHDLLQLTFYRRPRDLNFCALDAGTGAVMTSASAQLLQSYTCCTDLVRRLCVLAYMAEAAPYASASRIRRQLLSAGLMPVSSSRACTLGVPRTHVHGSRDSRGMLASMTATERVTVWLMHCEVSVGKTTTLTCRERKCVYESLAHWPRQFIKWL